MGRIKRLMFEIIGMIVTFIAILCAHYLCDSLLPIIAGGCLTVFLFLLALSRKTNRKNKKLFWYLILVVGVVFILLNDEARKPIQVNIEDEYLLNRGEYSITIIYDSENAENEVTLYVNDVPYASADIAKGKCSTKIPFKLEYDEQKVRIGINDDIVIEELTLAAENWYGFYTDTVAIAILFCLIYVTIYVYQCYIKKEATIRNTIIPFAIIAISAFTCFPLYCTSLQPADDLMYHMLRIEGIKDGILAGQVPVVIMPNGLDGNGYLNCMYPYLFLLIPALLRILRVSLILSYKVLIFLSGVATVSICYFSIRSMGKSSKVALLGSTIYALLPYRLANIYERGALGEILAMIFIPLILAGLYHLFVGQANKWYLLLIGFTGLLQSHILSFVLMIALTVVLCILFARELILERKIFILLKAGAATIALNLWFLVPFITYYLCGEIDTDALQTTNFVERSHSISAFLFSKDGITFGLTVLCCLVICIIYFVFFRKEKNKNRDFYLLSLFLCACVMAFFITGYSGADKWMELALFRKGFRMLQFPWRLYGPAGAIIVFVAMAVIDEFDDSKLKNAYPMLYGLLLGICLLSATDYMSARITPKFYSNQNYSDGHYQKVKGAVSHEASIGYPPEWRLHGVADDKILTEPMMTKEGTIKEYSKNFTDVRVKYISKEQGEMLSVPISGYYGYVVRDENDKNVPYDYYEEYAIQIPLNSDGAEHGLNIVFDMPIEFTISVMISFFTLIVLIVYWRRVLHG